MSPAASVSILQVLPKHNLFNLGNNESWSFNVQVVDSYSVSFGLPAGPSDDLSVHTPHLLVFLPIPSKYSKPTAAVPFPPQNSFSPWKLWSLKIMSEVIGFKTKDFTFT